MYDPPPLANQSYIHFSFNFRRMFSTWSLLDAPKASNRPGLCSKRHEKTFAHATTYSFPLRSWNTIAAKTRILRSAYSNWVWRNSAAAPTMSCATWTICRIWMVCSDWQTNILNQDIAWRFQFLISFFRTEDNNTRVLFERVLSSGGLTPQLSVEVWNRFLEFESNVGDLSSIVKVERRRSAVLENVSLAVDPHRAHRDGTLNWFCSCEFPVERIRGQGNRSTRRSL